MVQTNKKKKKAVPQAKIDGRTTEEQKRIEDEALLLQVMDSTGGLFLYYHTSMKKGYMVHNEWGEELLCVDLPPLLGSTGILNDGMRLEDGLQILIGGTTVYRSPPKWEGIIGNSRYDEDGIVVTCIPHFWKNKTDMEILAILFDPEKIPRVMKFLGERVLLEVHHSSSWEAVDGTKVKLDFQEGTLKHNGKRVAGF